MLTHLPCGGFGALDPKGETMRIVCSTHRIWERDAHGRLVMDAVGAEVRYKFRDTPGCGAITEASSGVRVIVGYLQAEEWAVARAIVEGDVYIGGHVKDALAAADGPKPKKPPPPPRPIKGRLAGAPQTLMLPMPRIIEGEIEEPGE